MGAIRRLGLAILGGGAAAMVLAGGLTLADRLCPPDLTRLATPSRIVVARDGTMLRAFMTADQQWRFPVTRIATGRVDVASTYLDLLLDVETSASGPTRASISWLLRAQPVSW